MDDERYPRRDEPQRGYQGRDAAPDYSRNRYAGDGRYGYGAGGRSGGGDQGRRDEQRPYGDDRYQDQGQRYGGSNDYHGGRGDAGRDAYRQPAGAYDRQQPQQQRDDRGFMDRAGDEVRSWFGDEDAERRREADAQRDERSDRGRDERSDRGRDEHYHHWRSQQIAAFDRDYDEYRQENRSKFHNEFSSWRTDRQGQRDLLAGVDEHAEVVGSDGEHVGTVDKVRGNRIILTKSDADAGGRHHSVPSSWLQSAQGGTVTLRKSAAEAKAHWRDEERSGAMFNERGSNREDEYRPNDTATGTNRSFSGR